MRLFIIAVLVSALGCLAQAQMVTIPAGTTVPLKLTSPLGTRTTRAGDSVRAETAFPVAAEGRVAIPAGTYVEGSIDKVRRSGSQAGFDMHFTRLVFANGYTALLSGSGTLHASLGDPGLAGPEAAGMAESLQSSCPLPPCLPVTPTLTPLPNPGPNKGLIIGGVLATVAVGIVAAILLGRHGGGGLYLDAGAPLQMVLQFPLSLEVAKLPPPGAAAPGAQ